MKQTLIAAHYTIPDATIGIAKVAITAYRCASCEGDFQMDVRPRFCPSCGARVIGMCAMADLKTPTGELA